MDFSSDKVRYDHQGLVVVIAQDHETQQVLMVAYMNAVTLRKTLDTGFMTYWSRSRQCEWIKGATSGNLQEVVSAKADCDADALLFSVIQHGGVACHTGARSCFFQTIAA